jgi:hypothetical protein
MRALLLASLIVTAALGAGATAAVSATVPSGVDGRVVARQSGLGCVRVSCFKPVAGVTVTFVQGDRTVRATSNRLGRFRISLSPGVWTARAPGLVAPQGGSLVLRVREGRYVPVAFVVRRATVLR